VSPDILVCFWGRDRKGRGGSEEEKSKKRKGKKEGPSFLTQFSIDLLHLCFKKIAISSSSHPYTLPSENLVTDFVEIKCTLLNKKFSNDPYPSFPSPLFSLSSQNVPHTPQSISTLSLTQPT
jgi:hypothetical protein